MANNTAEWWDIDGTSLHQYGWSVTTIGGARYDLPPRRGSNVKVAYAPGQRFVPKQPDSRVITLAMFLTGMDPATGAQTGNEILRWNDSWDFLRRLLWRVEGRQFDLTRRQLLTINGTPGILVTTGQGEFSGGMQPSMTGRTRAEFTMDILMASPYFWGNETTTILPWDGPTSVVNPGHDLAGPGGNLQVTMTGPLTNPRITNATPTPEVWVRYDGTIADGVTVTFDVPTYTATDSTGATVTNKVFSSGARWWMGLLPPDPGGSSGGNLLTLTSDDTFPPYNPANGNIITGVGHGSVVFRPPYV